MCGLASQALARAEPKAKVELIFSARTLPYGYGRNHGFSRAIKVVARPLYNIAAAAREGAHAGGFAGEDVLRNSASVGAALVR